MTWGDERWSSNWGERGGWSRPYDDYNKGKGKGKHAQSGPYDVAPSPKGMSKGRYVSSALETVREAIREQQDLAALSQVLGVQYGLHGNHAVKPYVAGTGLVPTQSWDRAQPPLVQSFPPTPPGLWQPVPAHSHHSAPAQPNLLLSVGQTRRLARRWAPPHLGDFHAAGLLRHGRWRHHLVARRAGVGAREPPQAARSGA